MKKLEKTIKEALLEITPSDETIQYMEDELKDFLGFLSKRLKKLKIDATPFVGGSFAKGTVIKGDSYDVDLFLRFDKKYKNEDLPKLTKKILRGRRGVSKVHGSRDYYQIKISPWFKIEVVPTRNVEGLKDAENVTDLSFAHVGYIRKRVKSKKILNEIKIAKAFCKATETYGAESYINGFSGYSIELLVYHYKTFEKFLREISRKRKDKLIIDIEKHYKDKKEILMDMNGSKLISPIVLIDPTFKERNATAALSDEVLEKFRVKAKSFLKSPKISAFKKEKIDLDKIKEAALKNKDEFILIETKTKKQEGDIAGTKLLKFHRHLIHEFSKSFNVKKTGFKYYGKKLGKGYFVLSKKDYILFSGPKADSKKHADKFKAEHEKTYVEDGRLYSKKEVTSTAKQFFSGWKKKNKRKVKEMYISKIKVI